MTTASELFQWPASPPDVPPVDHGWLCADTRALLAERLGPETRCVVELGSWLGKSARFILDCAPFARLYCVDTWAGSPEHHRRAEWAALLPHLFETFQVNCWALRGRLTPLRMRSVEGLCLLAERGVEPDLVYLDASHEYADVREDIAATLRLFPEAAIVGDDWRWKGVRRAAEEMADQFGRKLIHNEKAWCYA